MRFWHQTAIRARTAHHALQRSAVSLINLMPPCSKRDLIRRSLNFPPAGWPIVPLDTSHQVPSKPPVFPCCAALIHQHLELAAQLARLALLRSGWCKSWGPPQVPECLGQVGGTECQAQVGVTFSAPSSEGSLYSFPGATIADCHTPGGLKQQNFILSQFWGPEV